MKRRRNPPSKKIKPETAVHLINGSASSDATKHTVNRYASALK